MNEKEKDNIVYYFNPYDPYCVVCTATYNKNHKCYCYCIRPGCFEKRLKDKIACEEHICKRCGGYISSSGQCHCEL